jgi:hypothetical protein
MNLCIVNLAPAEYTPQINELAELLGKGPNNLSVKLQDWNGGIWYGCHSAAWDAQDFYDFQYPEKVAELGVDISEYSEALQHLVWSVVDPTLFEDYNAVHDNWLPALQAYELIEVQD